jgi:hypothetical protein
MDKSGTTSVWGFVDAKTYKMTSADIMNTLKAMGYNTGNGFQYSTFEEKGYSGSTIYNYLPQSTKKNTLNNGYPYLVIGNGNDGGHAWLIDGYGTMTKYTEGLMHPITKDSKQVTVTLTNCLMVHCNMGTSAGSGWYIDGIFDLGNMATKLPDSEVAPDSYPEFSEYVNWIAPTPIR